MAEKDSLLDLKSELSALKEDIGSSSIPDDDSSADMMDLKRRMDKSDQEMRAMTQAMKSTLLDVRSLMQDMDNPFNMLREMGVDKLVNKAVDQVKDEVSKQKREDAKKKMASNEEEDKNPSIAAIAPVAPSFASPVMTPQHSQPAPSMPMGYQPKPQASPPSMQPQVAQQAITPQITAAVSHQTAQIQDEVKTLVKRVAVTEQAVPLILNRVSRTETAVEELTDTVHELIDSLKGRNNPRRSRERSRGYTHDRNSFNLNPLQEPEEVEVYYEAYISLVADYLTLRFGEKGSEEILLEGMYKGWASPKVVRDIMDHTTTSMKAGDRRETALPFGLGTGNSDLEDKILLTSLLKNLDKPASEWTEPTHLFLLLALVTRARENQISRTES